MVRVYIPVTFVFLGWAFFEASGGTGFEAASRPEPSPEVAITRPAVPAPPTPEPVAEPALPAADPTALTQAAPETPPAPGVPTPEPAPAEAFESLSTPGNNAIGAAPPTDPALTLAPSPDGPAANLAPDIRLVVGDRVNMRTGPGTVYPVVSALTRDTAVEVLEATTNGWGRIEVVETAETGWISLRLLTEPQQ